MVDGIKLTIEKRILSDFLDSYANQVNSSLVGRIPYSIWKKLASLERDEQIRRIFIKVNATYEEVMVCSNEYFSGEHFVCITKENSGINGYEEFYKFISSKFELYEHEIQICKKRKSITEIEKGKENMNTNKLVNFDFGSCENDNVKMSMYGLAVKDANGRYVSYDKNANDIVDVDCMNFDGGKFFYKMPVAIKDIAVGDVVIHNRFPMFVTAIADGSVNVIDISSGEKKDIMPTKNMFGFNFITKVVSLMDFCGGIDKPTADSPFGNMLPFLLMSNSDGKDNLLPLALMSGGNMTSNPLMLYALMGNSGKENDLLPFALMMSGITNKES
jgi:hypothetical protein